jgi:predicted nucleotidyltransferase
LPGVTLVDIELEHATRRGHFVRSTWIYLAKIRDTCQRLDANCRVFVFGSFIKGGFRSNIDVLVVTKLASSQLTRGGFIQSYYH